LRGVALCGVARRTTSRYNSKGKHMFTLISRLPVRELLYRQAPTLIAALLIAELFYKWHSFLLESGGFLLTWFALDAVAGGIARIIVVREPTEVRR
jgi:hypothetical protein